MNNKELEQLFEAKRTVETNRRRQEELAKALKAVAAPRSRRLWPLWTTSAAAGIALLLMTLPSLFGNHDTETVTVAQTELPPTITAKEVVPAPVPQSERTAARGREMAVATKTMETIEEIETVEMAETTENTDSIQTIQSVPSVITVDTSARTTAPRIHRRTSTRMVNTTGTDIRQNDRNALRQMMAEAVGNNSESTITLKKIELS